MLHTVPLGSITEHDGPAIFAGGPGYQPLIAGLKPAYAG
jgi:hypothetical protein